MLPPWSGNVKIETVWVRQHRNLSSPGPATWKFKQSRSGTTEMSDKHNKNKPPSPGRGGAKGSQTSKCKYIIVLTTFGLIALLLIFYTIGVPSATSADMAPCIFCDISSGKMPQTKLEVETDEFVIFKDIKPASTYHYLAVPKIHYDSLKVLNKSHEGLITRMEEGLHKFLVSQGINTTDALFGFHLPPFITVKHLHMHAIAPRSEIGLFYRMVFQPSTAWFKTASEARAYLNRKEL